MTKPAKLYASLLANPRQTIPFRDFERLLSAFGFRLDRTRGSHCHYIRPGVREVFTINPSGKDAHRYQVQALLDLVEAYRLDMPE